MDKSNGSGRNGDGNRPTSAGTQGAGKGSLALRKHADKWEIVSEGPLLEAEERVKEIITGLSGEACSIEGALESVDDGIASWPECIELHQLRADLLERLGESVAADDAAETAYRIGARVVGDGQMRLDWDAPGNRSFLQSARALVDVRLRQARAEDAFELMERLLTWSPSDETGVSKVMGPTLLRYGRRDEAIEQLDECRDEDAGNEYDYALAHILGGGHAEAIRSLQRALIANPYIGEEILHGQPSRMGHIGCHKNDNDLRNAADAYAAEHKNELWFRSDEARALLRYVETHPLLRAERDAETASRIYDVRVSFGKNEEQTGNGEEGRFEPAENLIKVAMATVRVEDTEEELAPWMLLLNRDDGR